MAKLNQEDILAYLEEATILELNELVKAIEEKIWRNGCCSSCCCSCC